MFSQTVSTDTTLRSRLSLASPSYLAPPIGQSRIAEPVLSTATVVAGALIASAIVGRVIAWQSGGANGAQLLALMAIALLAFASAHKAKADADCGTIDARLAAMAMRAGGVQSAIGVLTLGLAVI